MKIYTESEMHEMYDDFLDEAYGDVNIAGMSYSTSCVFKEIDEIAYRCGFNDWLDSEGYEEYADGYISADDKETLEEMEEVAEENFCPECLRNGRLEYQADEDSFFCVECKRNFDESELLTGEDIEEQENEINASKC